MARNLESQIRRLKFFILAQLDRRILQSRRCEKELAEKMKFIERNRIMALARLDHTKREIMMELRSIKKIKTLD